MRTCKGNPLWERRAAAGQNAGRCGPGPENQRLYHQHCQGADRPRTRDPQPQEQEACLPWLRNQFALLRPKILVCLGRIAGQKLIKPDLKITKEHGIFFDKGGTLMMATLHPAALLRNPAQKPAAFEDYLKLREKIDELGCDAAKQ